MSSFSQQTVYGIIDSLASKMKIKSVYYCYKISNDTLHKTEIFYDKEGRIVKENYFTNIGRRNKLSSSLINWYQDNKVTSIDISWSKKPIYDTNVFDYNLFKSDTIGNIVYEYYNNANWYRMIILDSNYKIKKIRTDYHDPNNNICFYYNIQGQLNRITTESPRGDGTRIEHLILFYDNKDQLVEINTYNFNLQSRNIDRIVKILYDENGLPYRFFTIYYKDGKFELQDNGTFILYDFWN